MTRRYRIRSIVALLIALFLIAIPVSHQSKPTLPLISPTPPTSTDTTSLQKLASLNVKGRAPKTGYARSQFGDGWSIQNGCDTRNSILARDLKNVITNDKCQVVSGVLQDPYTGKTVKFTRGQSTSDAVQIDHVVALSNAWQTGAQSLTVSQREALANDPLELLAVDGPANQQKSDKDAATWLPPNKPFRCQYVRRQIDVKIKYQLWLTGAEKAAMEKVLAGC